MPEPSSDAPRGLIERDKALEEVSKALAGGLEPIVVVLEAAAGLGKSSVLTEVRARAQASGIAVSAASGLAIESDLPFALAARLLSPLVDASDLKPIDAQGPMGAAVQLLEDGVASGPVLEVTIALSRLVAELAATHRIALIVDDAHWADAPSLGFVRFVASRVDPDRVALVVATRPGATGSAAKELDGLRALPGANVVALEPLSVIGVGRVLRREFPATSHDAAAECHVLTGGNPLFVEEVVRELRADPDRQVVSALPSLSLTMAALPTVTARLDRLGPQARSLAQAASILSGGFVLDQAAALADLGSTETATAVEQLARAAIFRGDPPAFAHSLIERSVAATVTGADRQDLHKRAAELLRASGAHSSVVGQHLLHVPPGGEPDNVDMLLEASVLARNAGEPARALAFAERASAEPPAPDQRRRVLAEVARSAASADDERWHRLATAAIEHSPEHAPRLLESIGRDLMALSRIDEAAAAHAWGLRIVEDDPKEHLRLLARFVHAIRVRVDRPGDHLELVDELAAAVDAYPLRDTPEWRQAAALLAYQRAITVSTAAAVDVLARAALDPAHTTDREILEGVPYFGAVQAASMVGSDAELIAVERALEVGEKREAMHVIEVALAYRGSRRLREGLIDEAVSDLERARRLGPMVLLTVPKVMTELAQSLLEQGRVDAAQDALDSVDREVYRATGFYNGYLRTRGLVRAAHGDLEAALADLMHCGEREEKVLVDGAIAIPWAFDAAIVLVDLGRRPEATALLERPLAAARNQGVPFRIAHGLRALAATQAADSAVLTLRASLAVLDGTPWDLERLNAELALGRVLVTSGERAEALALLRGVVDRAHRQGAGRVAQLGLASLREAGTRPRRLAMTGEAALTPTEREIVRLASEGRTNAEIAKGREVSVKAVEHHLTSAFRKLGVRSRHELAR